MKTSVKVDGDSETARRAKAGRMRAIPGAEGFSKRISPVERRKRDKVKKAEKKARRRNR